MAGAKGDLLRLGGLTSVVVPLMGLGILSQVTAAILAWTSSLLYARYEGWLEFPQFIGWLVFVVWFYRAHRNLERGQVKHLRFAHWWTWAGFLIPILNLYRPIQVMRETLWGSQDLRPLEGRVSSMGAFSRAALLVNLWWLSFLLSFAVAVVFGSEGDASGVAEVVAELLVAASNAILIRVVLQVTALQDAAHLTR
ncbi:MAG: hypothetical protein DHS20C21_13260 [Gemmatimonadota bacterium]|nr:MAG: hypothetical protein DHS20C21_13260 [Gemmatimonadota bacterium]